MGGRTCRTQVDAHPTGVTVKSAQLSQEDVSGRTSLVPLAHSDL